MNKRNWLTLGLASALVVSGCDCGTPTPTNDGGAGGGAATGGGGGGTTGGGGGGTTGGGGGATGGGGGTTGGGDGGTTGGGGGTTAAVHQAKDVVSGSGRLTGGNFVLDAQLGQGIGQQPVSDGTVTLQGNAANKP